MSDRNLMMMICDLAEAAGIVPLNSLPGLWYIKLNEHYEMWANAHNEELKIEDEGVSIPPFHFLVKFNGWPFALFHPQDGVMGHGSVGNIETFMDAIAAKTEDLNQTKETV